MAKQVLSLALFQKNLLTYGITAASAADMKTALLEYAPKLKKAERVAVDAALVKALGKHYGVEPKTAEKNGVLSMLCFAVRDSEGNVIPAARNAATALSRCRSILEGKKKETSNESPAQQKLAALTRLAEKAVKDGDKETLKALRSGVRALMLLVA